MDSKLSHYNFYIPIKQSGVYLIYNSFTNSLFELPFEIGSLLDNIKQTEQDLSIVPDKYLKQLIEEGFIIDKLKNEIEITHRIKRNFFTNYQTKTNILSFTLLLTNYCNLDCVYCFEGRTKPQESVLSPEIIDSIIEFTKSEMKNKKINELHIGWYGGEPLLYPNLIQKYSEIFINFCNKCSINYKASIITNGVNLTLKNYDILKQAKVNNIQITIDGEKNIHDKRRPFLKSKRSSYEIILNNLKNLPNDDIPIAIRINGDKEVLPTVNILFEDLIKNAIWPQRKNVFLYLGHTKSSTGYASKTLFTRKEYADAVMQLRKLKFNLYNKWAINHQAPQAKYKFQYPQISHNYCGTLNNENAMVIDSFGNVSKCWEHVNDTSTIVGNIKDNLNAIKTSTKYQEIINTFTIQEKCSVCKIFPVCNGTFCPTNSFKIKTTCSTWKYNISKILKDQYLLTLNSPEQIEPINCVEVRINEKIIGEKI